MKVASGPREEPSSYAMQRCGLVSKRLAKAGTLEDSAVEAQLPSSVPTGKAPTDLCPVWFKTGLCRKVLTGDCNKRYVGRAVLCAVPRVA